MKIREAVLVGCLCLLGVLGVAAPAGAAPHSNPGHLGLPPGAAVPSWVTGNSIHFYPSSKGLAKAKGRSRSDGDPSTDGTIGYFQEPGSICGAFSCGPLLYDEEGGGVQNEPHIYAIFWGSNWNKEPGLLVKNELLTLFQTLPGSAYQDLLTQYFDASGPISSTVALTSYVDTSVTAPTSVTQASLTQEISTTIAAKGWPNGDLNAQFLILPAPGTTYNSAFTEGDFCAFHSYVSKSPNSYAYAFVPYMGDAPFAGGHCNAGTGSALGGTLVSASHEYAEAVTNPNPGKSNWDGSGPSFSEIADICVWKGFGSLPNGQAVALLWSNHQGGCSDSDPKPPLVYSHTGAAEQSETGATLLGTVNPVGRLTTYRFEYGTTTSYGNKVPATEVKAGEGFENVEARYPLAGLQPETTYHYRIVAKNSTGTVYGVDSEFTTSPWRQQQIGDGAPAELHETGCLGLDFCAAVGWTDGTETINGPSEGAYAEFLDSGVWRPSSVPDPISDTSPTLESVSCVDREWCMAVGAYTAAGTRPFAALYAYPWEVTAEPPRPTDFAEPKYQELSDVSCTSSTFCIAVGSYKAKGEPSPTKTLIEVWNGSVWQVQASPSPGSLSALNGVSCTSATACTAVGSTLEGTTTKSLALRWNGSSWTIQTTPNPSGAKSTVLEDVACATSSACMAVGKANDEANEGIAAKWSAGVWSLAPPLGGPLYGVACPTATACFGVGTKATGDAQAEFWNGAQWSARNPGLYRANQSRATLYGVSCVSVSICSAVGKVEFEISGGGYFPPESLAVRMPTIPPTAVTDAATGTDTIRPTLHATINPNGNDTHYYFAYGLSTKYNRHVPVVNNAWAETDIGSGTSNVAVSEQLPELPALEPGQTYHYAVFARNDEVTVRGADRTFKAPQPTIICSTGAEPCPEASRYQAGTPFEAKLKAGTKSQLSSQAYNVNCESSSFTGQVSSAGGNGGAVLLELSNSNSACNVSMTAEAQPWHLQIDRIAGTNNGIAHFTDMKLTTVGSGITCTYGGEVELEVKGGSEPELVANKAKIGKLVGGFACGEYATWSATYSIAKPTPLYVAAPLPLGSTVLCQTSAEPCPEASRYKAAAPVEAKLKTGTKSSLNSTAYNISCESSNLAGALTGAGGSGKTVPLELSSAAFGSCGGTIQVEGLPWHATIARAEGGVGRGTMHISDARLTATASGITCTYGGEVDLEVKGGSQPELVANKAKIAKLVGGFACGEYATWSATYSIAKPTPLYVSWP